VSDGVAKNGGDPGPPSLRFPTPQMLANLPTKPQTLLNQFKAFNSGKPDPLHYVLIEYSGFLSKCDLLLKPAARAALIRMLGLIDRLSAVEVEVNGRRFYVLIRPADRGADYVLFDAATSRYAGGYLSTDGYTVAGVSLSRRAVVNRVGQTG
jgi:hypothetical protein